MRVSFLFSFTHLLLCFTMINENDGSALTDYCVCVGYVDPESDGSLEDDLAARRYRALLPDDEYDSDDY